MVVTHGYMATGGKHVDNMASDIHHTTYRY